MDSQADRPLPDIPTRRPRARAVHSGGVTLVWINAERCSLARHAGGHLIVSLPQDMNNC